jgi:hypothetical protein
MPEMLTDDKGDKFSAFLYHYFDVMARVLILF